MTLSNKKDKLYSESLYQASKSSLLFKHGCVATCGGKIIAKSCNTYETSSNNKFIKSKCSCHAEMGVLNQIYYNCKKKHKLNRIMKKTILYISRSSMAGNSATSAPCMKCLEVIKEYKIKKIIFYLNDEYCEYNAKDYYTDHSSFGDLYSNNN